ncbi:glycosyl hydrolase family 3 C-terminal domain-containing protein [Aspergillus insuetus]
MGFIFRLQAEGVAFHVLIAGTTYRIRIRTTPGSSAGSLKILTGRLGFRFGMALAAEHDADLLSKAVKLAKEADYAIIFTSHTEQWETEGQDQVSFNLPMAGSQDALVVTSVNPNTIVVNSTGVPVAMPWLDSVAAVVQAWFGGQEAGTSIVDVLTGAVNPEGHLPVTFPKELEDAPGYGDFPGYYVDGQPAVEYKEGVFVGYRHYDRMAKDKVNFPSGHGLSYSTFEYSTLEVTKELDDHFSVCVSVKNTSNITGSTLAQIYAGLEVSNLTHPAKSLVGFAKATLESSKTQTLPLSIPVQHLAYFDENNNKWVVASGNYQFALGRSAAGQDRRCFC